MKKNGGKNATVDEKKTWEALQLHVNESWLLRDLIINFNHEPSSLMDKMHFTVFSEVLISSNLGIVWQSSNLKGLRCVSIHNKWNHMHSLQIHFNPLQPNECQTRPHVFSSTAKCIFRLRHSHQNWIRIKLSGFTVYAIRYRLKPVEGQSNYIYGGTATVKNKCPLVIKQSHLNRLIGKQDFQQRTD